MTVHDGFTLNDLVSYNDKHNEANGEGNRDGINENLSWNCGVRGPADRPGIAALRTRQIKNFVTILMLSRGVPMLLGGDEIRRTQGGNNNAVQPGQRDELVRLDDGRLEPRNVAVRSADDRLPESASGASAAAFLHGRDQRTGRGRHHVARHEARQARLRRSAWVERWRARSPGSTATPTCTS